MKRKLLIFFCASLILVPMVTAISLALVNLMSSPGAESSATTKVFVDPPWVWDETLQAGETFAVNINVSGVDDVFAWQLGMSWNSSVLNVTTITFGDFLAGTTSPNGTYSVSEIDNATGNVMFGETTLGDYPGVSGNGCLATIEFLVVGYGATSLDTSDPTLTVMLNRSLGNMEFTIGVSYFSNKIPSGTLCDIDGDGDVDSTDFGLLAGTYGASAGELAYRPEADFDVDGDVDSTDFGVFAGNYGTGV